MHLKQGEIRAFLENELQDRERVLRHLDDCPRCRQLLQATEGRVQFTTRLFNTADLQTETSAASVALAFEEFEHRRSQTSLLRSIVRAVPRWAWVSVFLCILLGAGLGVQHIRKAARKDAGPTAEVGQPPAAGQNHPSEEAAGRQNGSTGDRGPGPGHPAFQPSLGGPPGRFETGPQTAPTAELSQLRLFGRVVSATGQPIPGVALVASEAPESPLFGPPGPVIGTTQSDRNGRYEMLFEVWPDRRIVVLPSHPGFIAYRHTIVAKTGGDFRHDHVLWEEQSTVRGRIMDDANRAVDRAEVRLLVADPLGDRVHETEVASAHSELYRRVFSEPNGAYSLPGLPTGHVASVFVVRDGHLGEQGGGTLQPGDNIWDFRLKRGDGVDLIVKDQQGRPIRSVTATVWREGRPLTGINILEGDGKVRFTLAPGTSPFTCSVFADGYLRKEVQVDPKYPPREVILTEGLLVRGIVVSEEGEPIPGATVSFVRQEAFDQKDGASHMTGFPEGQTIQSDSQGRFEHRFSVLPDDRFTYLVFVSHPAYLKVNGSVDREEILSGFFTLELPKAAGGIEGQVIDWQGRPVGEFNMSIAPAEPVIPPDPAKILELTRRGRGFGYYSRVLDPNGRFSVSQIPAGDWRVTIFITSPSIWSTGSADIRITKGQPAQNVIIRLGRPQSLP